MKSVSVTIPGTVDVDKPAADMQRAMIREVAARMSEKFGGATATPGIGYYVDSAGRLIEEPVIVIQSYVMTPDTTAGRWIAELAKEIEIAMSQESVIYTIDGRPGFSS